MRVKNRLIVYNINWIKRYKGEIYEERRKARKKGEN